MILKITHYEGQATPLRDSKGAKKSRLQFVDIELEKRVRYAVHFCWFTSQTAPKKNLWNWLLLVVFGVVWIRVQDVSKGGLSGPMYWTAVNVRSLSKRFAIHAGKNQLDYTKLVEAQVAKMVAVEGKKKGKVSGAQEGGPQILASPVVSSSSAPADAVADVPPPATPPSPPVEPAPAKSKQWKLPVLLQVTTKKNTFSANDTVTLQGTVVIAGNNLEEARRSLRTRCIVTNVHANVLASDLRLFGSDGGVYRYLLSNEDGGEPLEGTLDISLDEFRNRRTKKKAKVLFSIPELEWDPEKLNVAPGQEWVEI